MDYKYEVWVMDDVPFRSEDADSAIEFVRMHVYENEVVSAVEFFSDSSPEPGGDWVRMPITIVKWLDDGVRHRGFYTYVLPKPRWANGWYEIHTA